MTTILLVRVTSFPSCVHACQFWSYAGKLAPCAKEEEKTPRCEKKCETGYSVDYKADKHFGATIFGMPTVEKIQSEIMKNGPVEGTMRVYSDFITYKTGTHSDDDSYIY